MIAQLTMYDRPSTRAANDRFWQAIRQELGHGPEALDRDVPVMEGWLRSDLILSQTCGYPFRALLVGKVHLVGTPDYGLPGCQPGYYRSIFVARREDARADVAEFDGAPFAYNEAMSQSGWAAPRHHADKIGIGFGELVQSGGHQFSARAVVEERADFAALDALTWALIQRDSDWNAKLKEVGHTCETPGLPYICGRDQDPAQLFRAIEAGIRKLTPEDRETLHLKGIRMIPEETYLAVPTPPAPDDL